MLERIGVHHHVEGTAREPEVPHVAFRERVELEPKKTGQDWVKRSRFVDFNSTKLGIPRVLDHLSERPAKAKEPERSPAPVQSSEHSSHTSRSECPGCTSNAASLVFRKTPGCATSPGHSTGVCSKESWPHA